MMLLLGAFLSRGRQRGADGDLAPRLRRSELLPPRTDGIRPIPQRALVRRPDVAPPQVRAGLSRRAVGNGASSVTDGVRAPRGHNHAWRVSPAAATLHARANRAALQEAAAWRVVRFQTPKFHADDHICSGSLRDRACRSARNAELKRDSGKHLPVAALERRGSLVFQAVFCAERGHGNQGVVTEADATTQEPWRRWLWVCRASS